MSTISPVPSWSTWSLGCFPLRLRRVRLADTIDVGNQQYPDVSVRESLQPRKHICLQGRRWRGQQLGARPRARGKDI
jgi:hypothetical protein